MATTQSQPPVLQVKIVSPKGTLFYDSALSVSSTNTAGKFDILPWHANFITIVNNVPIIIRKVNKEEANFKFPLAIIYVTQDKVNIYTDIQAHLI